MTIWTVNLYVLIAAIVLSFLLAQIRRPKNYAIELIKNFIGIYFIFSGIVKAIDPVGTAIKMEEYFDIFHEYFPFLNSIWDLLEPISLAVSVFMILVEILLGIFLILGALPLLTSSILLITILFFTFLTGFSHITGKVTDCGCFGDFLKLTPKVSFFKDIFLTILIIPLVVSWKKITPLFSAKPRGLSLLILSILAIVFTLRNIYYEPIVDFRPYKPGVNIVQCLSLPPDAKPYIYENTFIYKNNTTGKNEEFKVDQLPTDMDQWTFVDRIDKLIQKGDDPLCKDFAINDKDGNDLTAIYMNEEKPLFVLVIPTLDKMSTKNITRVATIFKDAVKDGNKAICLTGSNIDNVQKVLNLDDIHLDVFNTDETPLKTIMRSNPGILILKKGTILGKYHHNEEISYEKIKKDLAL